MNAVKKQFKDFWAFYRLTSYGGDYRGSAKSYRVSIIIVFVAAFLSLLQLQSEFYAFAIVACTLGFATGRMTADRRTLLSVAPFSPKQRTAFTYLALLASLLLFIAALNVAYCVVMLIVALITFCVTGENFLTDFFRYVPASNAGTGAIMLLCVIALFVTLILTYIESNKTRNIVATVYLAGTEFTALALANICGRAAAEEGAARKFYFTENLLTTVDKVRNAWIILVVFGAVALAMFGVSLWLIIRRNKPSKV